MLTFEFTLDEAHYQTGVDRTMRDTVRPGLADAVNAVADLVKRRLERAVLETFASPVPYTQHAFGTFTARPDDQDPAAAVFIYPQQAQYLALEVFGGTRQAGDYGTVPDGILIPGQDATLDSYGNLPRDFLSEAAQDPRDSWIHLGSSPDEVLVQHDGGGKIEILAEVVPETHYEAKFDFYGIVGAEVLATMPAALAEVFGQ